MKDVVNYRDTISENEISLNLTIYLSIYLSIYLVCVKIIIILTSKMSCIWIYFGYIAFIFQPHSSLGLLNTSANVNVALNKPTHQSSSVNWLKSPLAVDGRKETRNGCSQTAKELNPWWSVDLQEVYRIKSVKIYLNKIFGYFIWSLSVYVHMKSKGNMTICQHDITSFVKPYLLVDCQGEIGQFVTVKLENMRAILVICEVEVFGEKPFQTFHTGK
ncbi:unnamed protein product [Acanthosepion pharaonis]|uniref:Fucolectin tachylectin-4 pentraxin-1 domain-containing protein n=1 Tax=Acanthosepion pharaonis TaxID=158019 RepID=A0A812B4S2_ACAPH|nr:unnamed protein product [Sepia pharaonis]